jgi:hypothetical protein
VGCERSITAAFFACFTKERGCKDRPGRNGAFVASELPEDLLYGPPEATDRLVTGSGVWKLVSREGRQQVQLQFNTITAGQRGSVPYGTILNVSTGLGATVDLYYFQGGDADQGRRVEFEKK